MIRARLNEVFNDQELYKECKFYLDKQLEARFYNLAKEEYDYIIEEIDKMYKNIRFIIQEFPKYISYSIDEILQCIVDNNQANINGFCNDNNGQLCVLTSYHNREYLPIYKITGKGEDWLILKMENSEEDYPYEEDIIDEHNEEFFNLSNGYIEPLIYL